MIESRRYRILFKRRPECNESEELLWLFIENSPAPVAMLDREMRYIIVSRRWISDYRLTDADIIGKTHYEVFPEVPERWKQIHQRCLNGSVEKNEGEQFTRADGKIDWIRWEVRPWRRSSGEIGGIIMFTEVITGQKKTELALKELNSTLENSVLERTHEIRKKSAEFDIALDSIVDGVLIYDSNGRVIRMNPIATQMFSELGITKNQSIEERLVSMDVRTESGDPFLFQNFPSTKALKGESSQGTLMQIHSYGKAAIWFYVSAAPLKFSDGTLFGAIAIFVNISEQKQKEEKYRSILKTAIDGFWIMNLQGQFQDVNDSFCKIIGYSRDEILKMSLNDIEAKETTENIVQHIEKVARTGSDRFETRHRRKDGLVIDVEISTKFLRESLTLFVFARDITERKRIEKELRDSIESRDEFLSIASHEIKTPLAALLLQMELLRKLSTDFMKNLNHSYQGLNQLVKTATSAGSQVIRLSRLLDNLLNLTKIRAKRFELEPQSVDLVTITRNVLTQFETEASAAGTEIHFEGESTIIGLWDPLRMEQVIQNLVSNAIKYGAGKPIVLTLKSDRTSGFVNLSVEDQGPGIAPDLQKQIFNRFERGVADRKIKGTGLGLFIVRQIAEAHGGTVSVKSTPGKGSVFTVTLPGSRTF